MIAASGFVTSAAFTASATIASGPLAMRLVSRKAVAGLNAISDMNAP